jgi:hypothetical protein
MDTASFLATCNPELRDEILETADDTLLQTLPASLQAEAQRIRERHAESHSSVAQMFASLGLPISLGGGGLPPGVRVRRAGVPSVERSETGEPAAPKRACVWVGLCV